MILFLNVFFTEDDIGLNEDDVLGDEPKVSLVLKRYGSHGTSCMD